MILNKTGFFVWTVVMIQMKELLKKVADKHNRAVKLLDIANGQIENAIGHCLVSGCTAKCPCSQCRIYYKVLEKIDKYLGNDKNGN